MHLTVIKPTVLIGSKFNGPREHRDTGTGTFFAVLPEIDGSALKLQLALLKKKAQCFSGHTGARE